MKNNLKVANSGCKANFLRKLNIKNSPLFIDDFGYKPDTDFKDGIGEFVTWYREFYGEDR